MTQERPAEKPICICISNVEQLVAAKPPFSPLLWEFMRNVYPGGISCIVSKGEWLYKLGKNSKRLGFRGISVVYPTFCNSVHLEKIIQIDQCSKVLSMHRSGTRL